MYTILIKDSRTNVYRFFTVKKSEISQVNLKRISRNFSAIGTGRDDTIIFSTSSLEELESKCVELLKSYKSTDIIPVNVLNYSTDLVWGFTEDSNDKDLFEQEDMDFSDFFEDETTDGDNIDGSSDNTNDYGEELENDN